MRPNDNDQWHRCFRWLVPPKDTVQRRVSSIIADITGFAKRRRVERLSDQPA